jgi:DNA-binding MarR family transcriptional regulator
MTQATPLPPLDFRALAEFRYQIRHFLRFSEQAARGVGLEPHQHQFMLALKGLPEGARPSIGELAERLQIVHHSAVELVNRLTDGGYVVRGRNPGDRREVVVALTAKGDRVLHKLSLHHRAELQTQGPALVKALHRAMAGVEEGEHAPARARGRKARNQTNHKRRMES